MVICTLNRPKELAECLESLHAQTPRVSEFILVTERGSLATLRNQGWRQARGSLVAFLDDDVVVAPGWVQGVLEGFQQSSIVGISGPSQIPQIFRSQRDLYRYPTIRKVYDYLFVSLETRPGHLTQAGTFVPDPDWSYEGPVQFLEACNMAWRTEALRSVEGFDEAYGGIGDWSEPDLALRMRRTFGERSLYFSPAVRVEHRPSQSGAYLYRGLDARQRLANYRLFSGQWVHPHWRHWLYHRFLEAYYLGIVPCRAALSRAKTMCC